MRETLDGSTWSDSKFPEFNYGKLIFIIKYNDFFPDEENSSVALADPLFFVHLRLGLSQMRHRH